MSGVEYGCQLARQDGRRRIHLIPFIRAPHTLEPIWEAETTICGSPPPWDFDIERCCTYCRRCRDGLLAGAFDRARFALRAQVAAEAGR